MLEVTKVVILDSRHQKVKLLSSKLFLIDNLLYTPPISLCSVLDNHLTNYSKPYYNVSWQCTCFRS